jgi:hypothetical protein
METNETLSLTVQIITEYSRHQSVDNLPKLIADVHQALASARWPSPPPLQLPPPPPRRRRRRLPTPPEPPPRLSANGRRIGRPVTVGLAKMTPEQRRAHNKQLALARQQRRDQADGKWWGMTEAEIERRLSALE